MKEQDRSEYFSDLLSNGKLIDLCNEVNNLNYYESGIINTWYKKEEKNYILPLKSGSFIDESKILNASCLMGIKLSKEKVTSTQLRKLLNGFQVVKEKAKKPTKKSGNDFSSQISKLKLNLAYLTARNSDIIQLTDLLDSLLDRERFPENCEGLEDQFNSVVTLLEGVIAYHKLSGGRD